MISDNLSGAQRDRRELKAALDCVRRGEALVVWKLDWLARSQLEDANPEIPISIRSMHAEGPVPATVQLTFPAP